MKRGLELFYDVSGHVLLVSIYITRRAPIELTLRMTSQIIQHVTSNWHVTTIKTTLNERGSPEKSDTVVFFMTTPQ